MEISYVPIIVIILLSALFVVLHLSHNKKSSKKPAKQENKVEEKKEEKAKVVKNNDIQLNLRPDFSDMLNQQPVQEQQKGVKTDRLKTLKARDGLESKTNLYDRYNKKSKPNKLAKEIKELSPKMKTVLFGNVLDRKEDI